MVFSLMDDRLLAAASHATAVLAIWRGARAFWRWGKALRAAQRREAIEEFAFWLEKKRRAEEVAFLNSPSPFRPLSPLSPLETNSFGIDIPQWATDVQRSLGL